MIVTLPFPPLLNVYYFYKWGGRVLSAEGRRYKRDTLIRAKTQGLKPLEGPVYVSVTFFRKAKRGDIDGGLKCLLDALEGVAYDNDRQVRELHALQLEDPSDPRVRVTVEAWKEKAS